MKKYKVMGILNITPDSFSDGGKYLNPDKAYRRAVEMVEQGADVIDIGAESTRPGAQKISVEEEIKRIKYVIPGIVKNIKIPISIDSYKYDVIKFAVDNGVKIVNDITSGSDERVFSLVKKNKLKIILMHMRGTPELMQKNPRYKNVVEDIKAYLSSKISIAKKYGLKEKNIIIDPGIGFGKTVKHNLEIIKEINSFIDLGCEILVGLSRKSFLGKILNLDIKNCEKRIFGGLGATIFLALNGVRFFRTHDVKETKDALTVLEKIVYSG